MSATPIEEKIALLLKKAESTDSPHEAEALTEAAEKLMLKHGIERAMLDLEHDKKEAIIIVKNLFKGTYAYEQMLASVSIARALGLQAYYTDMRSWSGGVQVSIVGFESDANDALQLIVSLITQANVAVKVWAKSGLHGWMTPTEKYKARRSFIEHFGSGAAKRIRDNRKQTVVELGTGTELVLVERDAKVKEFFEDINLRKTSDRRDASYTGMAAGFAAGQNASTGERGLTQGKSIVR